MYSTNVIFSSYCVLCRYNFSCIATFLNKRIRQYKIHFGSLVHFGLVSTPPYKILVTGLSCNTDAKAKFVTQTRKLNLSHKRKTKFVTQTRKLNMSHRLATQTENLSCHTDGKLSWNKDAKTKLVTQTRKLNLPRRRKTKVAHRREN